MAVVSLPLSSSSSLIFLPIVLIVCILIATRRLLTIDHDPREPPLITSRILGIGHLFGIFRHGAKYFEMVNKPYGYPIYTLDTPGMRQYIVTSPHLAAQLQRSHKDLSFYNAITEVTRRLTGLPTSVMEKIEYNMDGHEGREVGIMPVNHDMFANVLGRGETLQALTALQLRKFSNALNSIALDGEICEISLQEWLQNVFTDANIPTIYGPDSPVSLDKSLIQSFWDFENGMLGLILDIFPALTMKKAYHGREKLVSALIDFIRQKRYASASPLIQQRVRINLGHGMTIEEAGRSELVLWFAILGNAVPSTFWVIVDIFSRPNLLDEIRTELQKAAVKLRDDGGTSTIDVSVIKSSCPLLVSSYRESLRLIGNLASIRYVLRDTVIGKQYLKGNSLIQVAGCIIHQDPQIWGDDCCEFNPRRFMKTTTPPPPPTTTTIAAAAAAAAKPTASQESELCTTTTTTTTTADNEESSATQLPQGVPSAAYRLFGGGSVTCPGRHFAQSEILGFVAYLIMAFDLTDLQGKTLVAPAKDVNGIPLTVLKPKSDIRVRIKRRRCYGKEGKKEEEGEEEEEEENTRWELIA